MHIVWAIPAPCADCHGLLLAFVCLHWPVMALRLLALAFVGLHCQCWSSLACVVLRWLALAIVGLRGSAPAVVHCLGIVVT